MDPVYAQIELQNLHCYTQSDQDNPNNPAEPYLWVVFFKIDGDTTEITESLMLRGTASVFSVPGDHGDLPTRGMKAGDNVSIPAQLGQFNTLVTPIRLKNPIGGTLDAPGFFGCVTVAMEHDSTNGSDARAGHEALNRKFAELVNELIPSLGITHPRPSNAEIDMMTEQLRSAVTKAIRDRWGIFDIGRDYDDNIGSAVFSFSQQELISNGGISLRKRMTKTGEDWELTGQANATSAKDLIDSAFLQALGLHPSEAELSAWYARLRSFRMVRSAALAKIVQTLLVDITSMDGEGKLREMIIRSYREAFGREPWDAEMESWFNFIHQHPITYTVLVNEHVTWLISPAGESEIIRVVERSFDNVRESAPSPAELATWVARIRNERLTCQRVMYLL